MSLLQVCMYYAMGASNRGMYVPGILQQGAPILITHRTAACGTRGPNLTKIDAPRAKNILKTNMSPIYQLLLYIHTYSYFALAALLNINTLFLHLVATPLSLLPRSPPPFSSKPILSYVPSCIFYSP